MGVVSSALYFGFTRYHLLCSPMCLVVIIHPNVYPAIHIYNPRESDTPCQLHERSLSILYEECKDFDLVLVPDAPMASALNRRLDQPHFGPFAITPRRLAARRREQAEDRLARFSKSLRRRISTGRRRPMRSGTSSSAGSIRGRPTRCSTTNSSRRRQRTPLSTVSQRWTRRLPVSPSTVSKPTRRSLSSASSSLPNSNARSFPRLRDDRSVHRGVIRSSILPHSRLAGRNRRRGPRCGHTGERRRRGCRPRCSQSVFTTH